MNIPEEHMDDIFTHLVALIENKTSPVQIISDLENTLQKAHIFDLDEEEGVLCRCVARLKEFAKNYEDVFSQNSDKNSREIKLISQDILICSSYIITFLQDLEEEGEIEIL